MTVIMPAWAFCILLLARYIRGVRAPAYGHASCNYASKFIISKSYPWSYCLICVSFVFPLLQVYGRLDMPED